jgi:ankyrin repeat protein
LALALALALALLAPRQLFRFDFASRAFSVVCLPSDLTTSLRAVMRCAPVQTPSVSELQRDWFAAVHTNQLKECERLLDEHKGTLDIEWTDEKNGSDNTALSLACLKNYRDLVSMLIARGAEVNRPGQGAGSIALLFCCW